MKNVFINSGPGRALFGLRLYVPVNIFCNYVGMFSWVEPLLSNECEVSCSRTQHCAPVEIQTRDSDTLPTELTVLPTDKRHLICAFAVASCT